MKKLQLMLQHKKALLWSVILSILYALFYQYSIGGLSLSGFGDGFSVMFVDDPLSKIFRQTAPFVWEPLIRVEIAGSLVILMSMMNLLVGGLLSFLVFLNLLVALYTIYVPTCTIGGGRGVHLFGLLPSFLTGFACCVPTVLIAFGSALTGFNTFFISMRVWLIPVSILLMLAGLIWSYRRVAVV